MWEAFHPQATSRARGGPRIVLGRYDGTAFRKRWPIGKARRAAGLVACTCTHTSTRRTRPVCDQRAPCPDRSLDAQACPAYGLLMLNQTLCMFVLRGPAALRTASTSGRSRERRWDPSTLRGCRCRVGPEFGRPRGLSGASPRAILDFVLTAKIICQALQNFSCLRGRESA